MAKEVVGSRNHGLRKGCQEGTTAVRVKVAPPCRKPTFKGQDGWKKTMTTQSKYGWLHDPKVEPKKSIDYPLRHAGDNGGGASRSKRES